MFEQLIKGNNLRASFISTFNEILPLPGSPRLFRYLAVINSEQSNLSSGSGFSINRNHAKAAAIGESIERYCAKQQLNAKDIYYKKYTEISEIALNPLMITRYTEEQYLNTTLYQDVDFDEPRAWVVAKNLANNQEILVPFELIYLSSPPTNLPLRDIISTGLACGQNLDKAILSGFNECIERDAFINFWLLGGVRGEIDLITLNDAYIEKLIETATNSNLEIRVYDITTDLEIPSILTVVKVKGKEGFYLGCASGLEFLYTIRKSIEEGLGGFSIYYELIHHYKQPIAKKLDNTSNLDDHPLYYLAGRNDEILSKLLPDSIPKITFENKKLQFIDVIENINRLGHEIYFSDITTEDVKRMGVSVVRVVIPTLCFLSINEPLLNCSRLQEKASILGKKINLEPHPFP
ncbi:YcaO-like family protein [Lysinibacillus sp. NPDC092081]|uniref:YcaO-like family protein n=1 Tax=Lysinibacillus sp. NPDC092081 TaxID=3364131 RepID=UPI00382EEF9F